MGVHETGEKRGVAQVDDLGAVGNGCAGAHSLNLPGYHNDYSRGDKPVGLAVEHAIGLQNDRARSMGGEG